jgi:outer membrane biosynthesis protein TonB
MRAGVITSAIGISALAHAVLVLLALFGPPKLFDSTPIPSVEVELVPSEDVPPPKPEPEQERKKDPDNLSWGVPSPPQAAAAPPPPAPEQSQQAALNPEKPQQPAPTGPQPSSGEAKQEAPPKAAPSIFDPANIPALLDLPNAPSKEFDSEARAIANLSADERATFKAHLQKCWKLQGAASLSQNTRVVLRVYLRRDATLAGDPVLIEARSPRDAKVLMDSATKAIKECQPFAFLPPDKYGEWKILDLSFTPRDMLGG